MQTLDGKTPFEAWTGEKPDVSHLRPFGTDVWIKVEAGNQSKLAPQAIKHVFVGFEDGLKAVRYYKHDTQQVLISRDYKFDDSLFYKPPQELKDGTEVEEAFLAEEEAMRIEEELLGYAYLAGDLKKNAVLKTLKEAMELEDWKNWKEAMDVEMAQLNKMGT
ncbi:hypothetical protein FRB96_001015 [Tulasnella sp. 330]|nr:hypothetical protein FRB96_001015 [Tulasnella sp. 330]